MLFYMFSFGLGALLFLGLYFLFKIKRTYDEGKALSTEISLGLWILDTIHFLLVILSSLYAIWIITIQQIVALTGGSIMIGAGLVVLLTGMMEFHLIRKISGLNTLELVTTGIYWWSMNPQYFGWFFMLLVSLLGRSSLAVLDTIIGIILFHFYITQMEEPYLERTFGKQYFLYKLKAPRYIGVPKQS